MGPETETPPGLRVVPGAISGADADIHPDNREQR
jgi:hypothetical protein